MRLLLAVLAVGTIGAAGSVPEVRAQANASFAEFVKDPLSFYTTTRATQVVGLSVRALADPATPPESRRAVLLTVGAVHVSEGRIRSAREAFAQILGLDPATEIEKPERMPRPAWRLFCRMRDSTYAAQIALAPGGRGAAPDIRTIAIGDIEANVVARTEMNMDAFARGLVHVITGDLQRGTSLRIVDRQRLDVLRDEMGLSREQTGTNPEFRVRVGQLYGAQSYLFGQIMPLPKSRVRMDLRWVNTSTGEILMSEGIEAKVSSSTDLFELERKVLLEMLVPRMEEYLRGQGTDLPVRRALEEHLAQKRKDLPKGTQYNDYVIGVGQALEAEERDDMDSAEASWRRAAALRPSDSEASLRAETAATFRKLRRGAGGERAQSDE